MGFFSSIGSKISGLWNHIKSTTSTVLTGGANVVKKVYSDVIKPTLLIPKDLVTGAVSTVKTLATGVSNSAQNISKGVEGLADGVGGGISNMGKGLGWMLPIGAAIVGAMFILK